MGRAEKSQGLAPPAVRKDMRAKQARHIINKVVPALLASNPRARRGVEGSGLIVNPGPSTEQEQNRGKSSVDHETLYGVETAYVKRKGQGRRKLRGGSVNDAYEVVGSHEREGRNGNRSKRTSKPHDDTPSSNSPSNPAAQKTTTATTKTPSPPLKIRIITTDTLTAAHMLAFPQNYTSTSQPPKPTTKPVPNPCILNMASPLRPGGGVLTGATSQEETLCTRTTLLPSLKESYYRLSELGGIYTSDVLVFWNPTPTSSATTPTSRKPTPAPPPPEKWYIDVISAAMLRFPELETAADDEKHLSKRDQQTAQRKILAVLRIADQKRVRKLVLGAWGCGAYGNPARDVADAFRAVLLSCSLSLDDDDDDDVMVEGREVLTHVREIVFAIPDRGLASTFAHAFGAGAFEVESGPNLAHTQRDGDEEGEERGEEDVEAQELRAKIHELEGQMDKVWNVELRERLGCILDGLRMQLEERQGADGARSWEDERDGEEEEEGDGMREGGVAGSSDEEDVEKGRLCRSSDGEGG
ncbi:hypothetical protein BDW02DRAFT_565682 [Decorospora gaudefroyi]|uniref:Microbial-type PARG catalytic domain-containing protein n=1 Tax=Decorospora gaudefroyi TaxID=184978 RepID=A0A6A5KKX9_9PLEO|nr:hypothetical protein BDW02DRAFT_565682 [Decorospora gaudefroyi]